MQVLLGVLETRGVTELSSLVSLWGSPKSRPGWFVPARDPPGCKASAEPQLGLRPQGVRGAGEAAGEKQGKPATAYLESVGGVWTQLGSLPELLAGQWGQSVQRGALLPPLTWGRQGLLGASLATREHVPLQDQHAPESPPRASLPETPGSQWRGPGSNPCSGDEGLTYCN